MWQASLFEIKDNAGVKRRETSVKARFAFAPDGVIEGIVYEPGGFALGVQWHPELQAEQVPLQRRIFEALVARAGETR